MNDYDKEQFSRALVESSFVFPREITTPLKKIYFEALEDLDINDVYAAFKKHNATAVFFPKPIDIRNIINSGKPNNEDKAVLAWLSITNAISKIGPYRTLTLEDRLAMEIVNHVGGWSNLCNLSYKELDFKKREFVEAYTTTAITSDKDLPKSLVGLHDVALLENKDQ
jgi:hypothetical protein